MERIEQRIIIVLVALVGVLALGTLGYVVIEGWPVFDALYMTVITLGTVGYGETHPLSTVGRAYTIVLILVGLGVMGYGVSTVTAFFVEGDLADLLGKRKMERKIKGLRDHVILIGAGETGKHIAQELLKTGTPFVVVDRDAEQAATLERLGQVLYLVGDATDGEVLQQAQIEYARGLISSAPSDKDNLFVILTARELHPSLRIVSRVTADDSRPKLLKAGADAVVSSNLIGGLRMASEMLRPHVVSFLDAMLRATAESAVRVEEVQVPPTSPWVGRSLEDVQVRERVGVVVFGLREGATGKYVFNPAPSARLDAGDILICCADREQLASLRRLVSGA
ncbi:MAG: potassium channel protein [Candidatus Rokubacteria bacterium]|nr:potassium channel protein [Candidatus Rokubacteria bacterium]